MQLDTKTAQRPKAKELNIPMCTDYFKGNTLTIDEFKAMHRHRLSGGAVVKKANAKYGFSMTKPHVPAFQFGDPSDEVLLMPNTLQKKGKLKAQSKEVAKAKIKNQFSTPGPIYRLPTTFGNTACYDDATRLRNRQFV